MSLKKFIIRAFELKPEEYTKFLLLFFHSFFLGLFIAFYFVPANSIFIQHFSNEELPLAYIASGLVGYLSTLIYSNLQKRVSSRALFLGALLFMAVVTIIGRLGLNNFEDNWLSFFVFIWAWPFISLVGIESGGLAIRLLNLRQVKRLFGLINMGGVIASIIGYLAIPLVRKLLSHDYDLLFIGVSGVFISIVLLFVIYKQFPEKITQTDGEEITESPTSFKNLVKDQYFRLIFVSAILSMAVIYFSDFGFLASINEQKGKLFPLNETNTISNFMAVVYGTLKIGELVMSYFSSRILSKYGVKLGLTILPLTSTSLIVIATATGIISGADTITFFAFIVLNKTLERVLRRSLDDPSFNILYQPLPDEQKLSIQTKVGVIMQISIGIAGVFLFLVTEILATPTGFNLRYYPLLFLPFLLTWSVVSIRLYNAYKEKIRQILKERARKKDKDVEFYGTDVLVKKLREDDVSAVERSVMLLSETNPRALELYAVNLLEKYYDNTLIVKSILKNINPTYRQEFKRPVENILDKTNNEEVKELAEKAIESLNYGQIQSLSQHQINKTLSNDDIKQKLLLIKHLFLNKIQNDEEIILQLLEENDATINRAAIKLAGKRNSPVLRNKLIDMLKQPEYSHIISSTILEIGEKILNELEGLFKVETPTTILLKVIEIYAKMGTQATKSLLVGHINYPDKDVQIAVIKALYFCQYQVNIKERPIIKQKLEDVCENILWAFASINDLETQKNTLKLIQALDLEREQNFEIMFYLLSFIYQPATIDLIKTNIIGENIIFALEIIENFISQDVKQLIIPLLDKLSVTQRMKKLRSTFPHLSRMRFTDRLRDIITRDFNKVDLWTIAKALELLGKIHKRKTSGEVKTNETEYQNVVDVWTRDKINELLGQIRKSEMPDEIFVCLYHPDELVYSTAAKIIYDENPTRCINNLRKLSPKKQELIPFLSDPEENKNLLIERVKLIKRVPLFFSVPENVLVKLVKLFIARRIRKNDEIRLVNSDKMENIYIVLRGGIRYSLKDEEITFSKNDIIARGSNVDMDTETLTVKKDALVLVGNRFEYYNLLVDEVDIIKPIFQMSKK